MTDEERIKKIIKTIKRAYSKNAKWKSCTVRTKEFVPIPDLNVVDNSICRNDNYYPEFNTFSYVFGN